MPGDERKLLKDIRTVIYATDFSLYSQSAGFYAARLAEFWRATLLVVHAFTLSQAAMEVEIDHLLISQQRSDLSFLLARKAAFLSSPTMQAIPMLLEGAPKTAIPRLAEQQGPSIVVLGTHGGGWIQRGLIGSVAEQVLRTTSAPSLIVGPNVQALSAMASPFSQILLATDFAPDSVNAAAHAMACAEAFQAKMDILNVVTHDDMMHQEKLAAIRKKFYEAMGQGDSKHLQDFFEPRLHQEVGKVRDRVLAYVHDHAVDLLVLSIRDSGYPGLEAARSGAFPLIAAAKCPVLTVVG